MTYNICCEECKEKLGIGQTAGSERSYIWTEKEDLVLLERFLFTHEGHELMFYNGDANSDMERYDAYDFFSDRT